MPPTPSADDPLLWIALAEARLGRRPKQALLDRFGSPSRIFRQSRRSLEAAAGQRLAALSRGPDLRHARARLEAARREGVRILPRDAGDFPTGLREIPDAPLLVYVKGSLPELPAVAIVGSRRATGRGRAAAHAFAEALARAGAAVVSGLALGIDAEAHRGALAGGGATVAVLASGVAVPTPRTNRGLARSILERGGALLSEHPTGSVPHPGRFPERNRLISGLAHASLIVEAREASGSLWTARHAMEQGRDVFAVPGPVDSDACRGSNRLLRDGAGVALEGGDLHFSLGLVVPEPAGVSAPALGADDVAARVLRSLADGPLDADTIARHLSLSHAELAPVLLELELSAQVRRTGARIGRMPPTR